MTVLKNLAFGLFVIVAILIGIGFALPDSVHIERSVSVNARPATAYAVLNSFKLFNRWSPWAQLDPNAAYAYIGPDSGVGSRQTWSSDNPNVGAGSQEIIESVPYSSIKISLVFGGFDTDNIATYTITPEGEGSRITWGYDSHFRGSLLYRYFGLVTDRMLGPEYERGLAQLKPLLESLPPVDFSTLKVEQVDVQPIDIAYTSGSSAYDSAQIGQALGEAYTTRIGPFLKQHGLTQTAAPLAIYDACEPGAETCSFRAGIPVDRNDVPPEEGSAVQLGQTYGGKALRVIHTGSYNDLGTSYTALLSYVAAHALERNGPHWEHYISDPSSTAEAERITHLYLPIQ